MQNFPRFHMFQIEENDYSELSIDDKYLRKCYYIFEENSNKNNI